MGKSEALYISFYIVIDGKERVIELANLVWKLCPICFKSDIISFPVISVSLKFSRYGLRRSSYGCSSSVVLSKITLCEKRAFKAKKSWIYTTTLFNKTFTSLKKFWFKLKILDVFKMLCSIRFHEIVMIHYFID